MVLECWAENNIYIFEHKYWPYVFQKWKELNVAKEFKTKNAGQGSSNLDGTVQENKLIAWMVQNLALWYVTGLFDQWKTICEKCLGAL